MTPGIAFKNSKSDNPAMVNLIKHKLVSHATINKHYEHILKV